MSVLCVDSIVLKPILHKFLYDSIEADVPAAVPVAAPVEEPVIEPVSSEPDHTVEKPHATAIDPDDSNDPGPSD